MTFLKHVPTEAERDELATSLEAIGLQINAARLRAVDVNAKFLAGILRGAEEIVLYAYNRARNQSTDGDVPAEDL